MESEIRDFQNLVRDMAQIESPYKGDFVYMRSLINREQFNTLTGRIELLINEFNHFTELYEKIADDEEVRQLYIKSGLLDKSLDLQTRITNKLN